MTAGKSLSAAVVGGLLIASAAHAQAPAAASGGGQMISMTYHVSVPIAMVPLPSVRRTTELLILAMYDVVDHECDVLSVALKGNCRIVQLNVVTDLQSGSSISSDVKATYAVDQKSAAAGAP